MVREAASPVPPGLAAEPPTSSDDVVMVQDRTARERGGYPLVWGSDNCPTYVCGVAADLLARERVIHLRYRPHTPTDNSRAERGIGELKSVSALSCGLTLGSLDDSASRLGEAREWLRSRAVASVAPRPDGRAG